MDKSIIEKAKDIKLILTDVDGVLTRGEIIFVDDSREIKIWNVKDGLGFTIAKKIGDLKVGWITGRKSNDVASRAKELGIDYLFQGSLYKQKALDFILDSENLDYSNVLYIGDDILDIPLLEKVGLSVCPNDACSDVKDMVMYKSPVNGGKGVFRDVLELVLKAQKRWKDALNLWR